MVSDRTRYALLALADNECAFPGCDTAIVDTASGSIVGEFCHVRARSEGGPRHVPGLTDAELNAPSNLIVLCRAHHKVVDDNPETFPIERLERMKAEHESRSRPLDRDRLLDVLSALAPPAVPEDWWHRPGAPMFRLQLASSRPQNGAWTFDAAIEQQLGTDIGNVRGRFAGDMAETAVEALQFVGKRDVPKWRLPSWNARARSKATMELDRELRFWWDGAERVVLLVWPVVGRFQEAEAETRYPSGRSGSG